MENYIKYLRLFQMKLDKYFENQSPYIKCKLGCAKCCSNGDYPFSDMEVKVLKLGFSTLDNETQSKIINNIKTIKKSKSLCNKDDFRYQCPFLLDNKCSVYNYRGLICRTFGLLYLKDDGNMQIPFCAYEGLNFSNILDCEKKYLSAEKMKSLGIEVEPKAYNIKYEQITNEEIEEICDFKFGRKAPLIDLLSVEEFETIQKNT